MKKTVSIVLALILTLMCSSLAFAADTPKYKTTQYFLNALDKAGIKYSYQGTDSDGDDVVKIGFSDDDLGSITTKVFFDDSNLFSVRVWNLLSYSCGVNYAYQICNSLNLQYKYVKFYADTSDNTITVSIDSVLSEDCDCGEACLEMFIHVVSIINSSKEELLKLK